MHRDMKVGLALGVLLVGVVGALFFRREPEKKPVPPSLQNGSQIDRQIAERARGPYLTQPEEFVDASVPAGRGAKGSATGTKVTVAKPPVGSLSLDEEAQLGTPGSGESPKSVATSSTNVPAPLPGHNENWEAVGSQSQVAREEAPINLPARTVANSESTANMRIHVVESGETLSGLAAKYLGSTARYREIYEANRDVLRSPDSLTAGLPMKIPNEANRGKPGRRTGPSIAGNGNAVTRSVSQSKRERTPAVPAAAEETVKPEVPAAETGASTTPKFTPVRRSPFAAGRAPGRTAPRAVETNAPAAEASPEE